MNKCGRLFGWAFVGSLTLSIAGCSGADDGEESDELGEGEAPGCQAWQTALCDWIESCDGVVGSCREQVMMTACNSDSEAQACSERFTQAACSAPPAGCDLASVVDTAPAVAACEQFIDAWCGYAEECEPGSNELCVSESENALGCSGALGVGEGFDDCLAGIDALSCSDEPALPEPCRGVLLLPN